MKCISRLLLATAMISSVAQARPPVEHFTRPRVGGQSPPFSEAVRVGAVFYLSGQIGAAPDGKLPDGVEAQTTQALDNIGAILKRANLHYSDVFHCTAFLSDMKNWPAFNQAYVPYFPAGRLPARSALGANGLALGALLELEWQAYAGN